MEIAAKGHAMLKTVMAKSSDCTISFSKRPQLAKDKRG